MSKNIAAGNGGVGEVGQHLSVGPVSACKLLFLLQQYMHCYKSDLIIEVLNVIFLFTEYWPCSLFLFRDIVTKKIQFPPRHWNIGLMFSRFSLTSWGEGISLEGASSDGITIKIPYGVDVLLHWPASHHIFSYWVG